MNNERRRRPNNWGSVISFLIFLLFIAGRPLLNLINQLPGVNLGSVTSLLPLLIGGLVLISIIVSVVRAVGGSARRSGDTRLPTSPAPASSGRASAPMPPFGGPSAPSRSVEPPIQSGSYMPPAPQFEPLINPVVLIVGIVGVVLLGGLALFVLGQSFP